MSDQAQAAEPATTAAANPAIVNATQALAIKELGESVAAVKKQVKTLWIAFAVLAVVTVAVAGVTIAGRLGLGMGARPNFQRGTFSGQPTNGTPGTGTQGTGGPTFTTP